MSEQDREFRDFVVGSQQRLVHFAELLTGDRGRAEDLVQDAFVAAYVAWPRISRNSPEAYLRRCIINGRTNWWRLRSSHEQPTDSPPNIPAITDESGQVDQRLLVLSALNRLTQRERTVLALRFFVGLSEREIAAELDIAAGTVKSTAARAVIKLREDDLFREGASP